jgi:hypothetical protein
VAAGAADAFAQAELVGAMDRLAATTALDAGVLEGDSAEDPVEHLALSNDESAGM